MKLVSFHVKENSQSAQPAKIGVLEATRIIDLQASYNSKHGSDHPALTAMMELLAAGPSAMSLIARLAAQDNPVTVALDEVQLAAPLPRPNSIRDCMAFERHYIQCARTVARSIFPPVAWLDRWIHSLSGFSFLTPPRVWYRRPVYYKGNCSTVAGQDCTIPWPPITKKLDFEMELAAVVGKQGRNLDVESARDHIAGYTIFNDFSARDIQLDELKSQMGPAKSKDFDLGNVLGPCLVTPDEMGDPHNLRATVRVNGEEWAESSTSEIRYRFEEIISFVSQGETIYPGDVIGSGTVPNGCGFELDRWIQPGDIVELQIDPIGTLRSVIGNPGAIE